MLFRYMIFGFEIGFFIIYPMLITCIFVLQAITGFSTLIRYHKGAWTEAEAYKVAKEELGEELAQVKADADKARQEAEEAVAKAQKTAEDAAKRVEDAEKAATAQRRQVEKVEAEMAKLRTGHGKALQLADEKGFLDGQKHAFNRYSDEFDDLKPVIHFKSYTEGYLAGHATAHSIATSVSPVT